MEELKTTGKYTITLEMKEKLADFAAGYSTEEETAESIHDTYQKTGYVMDTHTAVAAHVCGQYRAKVVIGQNVSLHLQQAHTNS